MGVHEIFPDIISESIPIPDAVGGTALLKPLAKSRLIRVSSSTDCATLAFLVGFYGDNTPDQRSDAQYLALYAAVDHLENLPSDDSAWVEAETAHDAKRLLALMSLYDVLPPKIFSHGGDAIVLTWEFGDVRRYLTVCDGEATILDVRPAAKQKCVATFKISDFDAVSFWMEMLGGRRWNSASV